MGSEAGEEDSGNKEGDDGAYVATYNATHLLEEGLDIISIKDL